MNDAHPCRRIVRCPAGHWLLLPLLVSMPAAPAAPAPRPTPVPVERLGLLEPPGTRQGDLVARSGRRVPGTVPRFPSADLVVERINVGGGAELLFFCDGVGELQGARLARRPGAVEVVFTARTLAGAVAGYRVEGPDTPPPPPARWSRLPDLPVPHGRAGAIAGQCDAGLLVAGGTNFPGASYWDGGRKAWYADAYVLPPDGAMWRQVGELDRPRAHAVALSVAGGVLVAGGQHDNEVYADAFVLSVESGKLRRAVLPALPHPLTMSAGAAGGDVVYLAGGYDRLPAQDALAAFWRLDRNAPRPQWERLPPWPGPGRAQAVMAILRGDVYVMSGITFVRDAAGKPAPVYLRDAYRYRPGAGWEKLPDLPWSVVAAPSPAPADPAANRFLVLGGVDGTQVGRLPRESPLPDDVLAFDGATGRWELAGFAVPLPTVTNPVVRRGAGWILPTGEIRAGVRTPQVWSLEWPATKGMAQ